MPQNITRRTALAALAATGLQALGGGRLAASPVADLNILAAPTGASITLARALDSGALAQSAPNATFNLWRDPDMLRAGIVSGQTKLFSTPTHLPANLANRGMPIKLLCLIGQGHLSIVTADESINSFHDLAGKDVLGFFRNDMPDLIFRACARMEGMDPDKDIKLTYVQDGMEAAQMLASGKVPTAILSEPPAAAAIMMAEHHSGLILRRAISLQNVWSRHKNGAHMPMVGVAVQASLVEQAPELLAALKTALPLAKTWVETNPTEAGALAEKMMQMRPHIFEAAVPHLNIDIVSARAARPELEVFYQTLLEVSPQALGGKLPSDDFYLDF